MVVLGVITVAELADRVATDAVALKRLWDDVKDVPVHRNYGTADQLAA